MKFSLRLLLVAFAVSFLLVAMLSFISLLRFSQLTQRVTQVEHSYKVGELISRLKQNARALDDAEFRLYSTSNPVYARALDTALAAITRDATQLKDLVSDNHNQLSTLVLFQSDVLLYKTTVDSLMAAGAPYERDDAKWSSDQSSEIFISSAAQHLNEMAAAEQKLLQERTADRDAYRQLTSAMIRALMLVFGVITLILFYLLLHTFRQRLRYQVALQEKIDELAASKRELEHIAYATSHDLQEPLRKIRIFTDRLQQQTKNLLPAGSNDTLERVMSAAAHMQGLVQELMVLTSLSAEGNFQPCPLNKYVADSLEGFQNDLRDRGGVVEVAHLPTVSGNPKQLRLLFDKLLDNALKFARPGVAPLIRITAETGSGSALGLDPNIERTYHCISIQDNGVGFDNSHAEKMFGIFRQLQNRSEGRGTGLAICQRIMNNHKGQITAHGFPGGGATFKLYFPVME